MLKNATFLLLCFGLYGARANAEDIDPVQTINNKLSQMRDYQLKDACSKVVVGTKWETSHLPVHHGSTDADSDPPRYEVPVYQTQCVPQIGKLSVTSLSYESVTFDKSEVVQNAVPEKVMGQAFVSINCSKSEQTPSLSFVYTQRNATSTVTLHGITNSIQANAKISYQVSKTLGVEFGVQDTYQVQNSTSNTVQSDTTAQKTVTLPLKIDPMTNFTSQGWIAENTDRLSWHASVIMSGQVTPNKENISDISVILSEKDRTFGISGYIENVHSTDIQNNYYGRPLTDHQCEDIIAKKLPTQYRLNYLLYPASPTEQDPEITHSSK